LRSFLLLYQEVNLHFMPRHFITVRPLAVPLSPIIEFIAQPLGVPNTVELGNFSEPASAVISTC
jgi:hypothetical protein